MRLMSQIEQIRKSIDHIDLVNEFCSNYLPKCTEIQSCKLVRSVTVCLEYLKSIEFHSTMPSRIVFTKTYDDVRSFIRNNFGTFDLPPGQESLVKSSLPYRSMSLSSYPADEVTNALSNLNIHRRASQSEAFLSQNLPLPMTSEGTLDSIRNSTNGGLSILPDHQEHVNPVSSNIPHWDDSTNFKFSSTDYKAAVSPMNSNSNGLSLHRSLQFGVGGDLDLDSPNIPTRLGLYNNAYCSLYDYTRLRYSRSSNMSLMFKFGTLGSELGRFNSPHGFCLGFDDEIVVADTYNHRIQVG